MGQIWAVFGQTSALNMGLKPVKFGGSVGQARADVDHTIGPKSTNLRIHWRRTLAAFSRVELGVGPCSVQPALFDVAKVPSGPGP